MEKIALIVPTYAENPELIKKIIQRPESHGRALHSDTYQHYPKLLRKLLNQNNGRFKIYVYLKKTPYKKGSRKGSGKVEYIYHVGKLLWDNNNIIPCPDKKLDAHLEFFGYDADDLRCWNYVDKVEKLNPPKDWGDFHLYPSGKTSKVQGMLNRKAHWYYVIDEY